MPGPSGVSGAVGSAVTTAAPAPSPSRTQVERSVQSAMSAILSAPMTRARLAAPARIVWSAVASACVKPEHTTLMSITAGEPMPSRAATRAAMLGDRSIAVEVATRTRSMSEGASPAVASALAAACAAISSTGSSGPPTWRVLIPTRLVIHSSLVSTMAARSSLVSTLAGW